MENNQLSSLLIVTRLQHWVTIAHVIVVCLETVSMLQAQPLWILMDVLQFKNALTDFTIVMSMLIALNFSQPVLRVLVKLGSLTLL